MTHKFSPIQKLSIKKLFFITVTSLLSLPVVSSEVSISKNLFLQRAFSANTSREMFMEGNLIKTDFDGFFSLVSVAGAYQHSWNQDATEELGAFALWSGTNRMTVGTNDSNSSLDAYQFGLGNVVSNGSIELNPIVYQGGVDFLIYSGSSTNDPGMFFKLKAPLGVIGIDPVLTETQATAATSYDPGALSVSTIAVTSPATTMTQAFAGNLADGQSKNGDFIPMQYGLIDGKKNSGVKFGDIEMALGYNFICNDDYLFGFALRASGPSANKPECQYLLEPLFGRGGSWGLGGYLHGKMKLWENNNDRSLSVNMMGTVLHLMKTDTLRSFDLAANGPGSKYLLVANYSGNEYQGTIQNLINLSTLTAESSFSAEGDASIALSYLAQGWAVDFGYNFWGRTAEELSITQEFPVTTYAVLGRQGVGFVNDPSVNSNACQPLAYINLAADSITNSDSGTAGNSASVPSVVTSQSSVVLATIPANRIAGNTDFDVHAAEQASASTSKIFARCVYTFQDYVVCPFVGVSGEFEISTSKNNALSQWGVALIGGAYF